MATNLKIDFDELYKSVFKNSDEVQLLTEVESRFVRDYIKPQDRHDKEKISTNPKSTA